MTSYLAPELDPRLVEAAALMADSFLPAELEPGQTQEMYGDPAVFAKLRELQLPSQAWLDAAGNAVAATILKQTELREAMELLWQSTYPLHQYFGAWVFAGILQEADFSSWSIERLDDILANQIIEYTRDHELAELATDQISDWIDSAIYAHLRTQIAQLALSIKNEAGQSCLEILEAAGLIS